MKNIDHLGLDGNTLRTFLTVLEEVSASKAAIRLGVSQSSVSHTLDKLRIVLGDPLFIREGRGIVPTTKALSLRKPVESIIGHLKLLTCSREFDPLIETIEFTIAANDILLELLFPPLLRELYAEGISSRLTFIPSGVPNANLARASRCQMMLTPAPPQGDCFNQEKLFEAKAVCFYDANIRKPPSSWKQYCKSQSVDVKFSGTESSLMAIPSLDTSALQPATVTIPNFGLLKAFIKGTNLITTQLSVFEKGVLEGINHAPVPYETTPVSVYLVWHRRYHDDPAHRWLRERIVKTAKLLCQD